MYVIADFIANNKTERDEKLDMAVASARIDASTDGTRGILVTRHDFSHFSVSLSPNVPFGLTHEHDCAGRN
jgi:hypothetical protein